MFRNRLIALPLLLACPFAVAACGGDDDADTAGSAVTTAASTAEQPATTTAPATTAPDAATTSTEPATTTEAAPPAEDTAKTATEKAKTTADESDGRSGKQTPDAPASSDPAMAAMQKKMQEATAGLSKKMQDIQKQMTDGKLKPEQGQKQLAALSLQMQQAIIDAADELDRQGKLPAEAKKQLDAMKKQVAKQKSAQ